MIRNAIIVESFLGYDPDHGILTSSVTVEFDGGRQNFGGYNLGYYKDKIKVPCSALGPWIIWILDITGSKTWEGVIGKPIRIDGDDREIKRIGHYLQDRWFNPKESLK